jgi:hypothetical protein
MYPRGGIIPQYDTYALSEATKTNNYKELDEDELAFTAYGSSRVEAMAAVDRFAEHTKIPIRRVEHIDW